MKKVIIGFIAGAIFATAGTAMADTVIKKVTASVRVDYKVEMNGKQVELKNSPLVYDGSSYLPVKEMAELMGKEVNFKDGVIKLDTPIADPASELARLQKDLEIAQSNLNNAEKIITDAKSGKIIATSEQLVQMEETRKAFQSSVDYNSKKITELLEKYPELAQ